MFHTIVNLIIGLTCIHLTLSRNLNGIFTIDLCQCSSSKASCDPFGPFIVNHQKSSISIKFGSALVGSGKIGNQRLDLQLNQHPCNGSWNDETHVAELKCQHQNKISCTTHLRCISGLCLENATSIVITSASKRIMISYVGLILSSWIVFA